MIEVSVMPKMIDLTIPVAGAHFRWPPERRLLESHAAGDIAEATWSGTTAHAFTPVAAPRRFDPDGPTTDALTLTEGRAETSTSRCAAARPDLAAGWRAARLRRLVTDTRRPDPGIPKNLSCRVAARR